MLKTVKLTSRPLADYLCCIDDDLYSEVLALSLRLNGKRILQLSATDSGGGVSEMLHSEVALCRGMGLDMTWRVLQADASFFSITKKIHNALQGGKAALTAAEWHEFEDYNKRLAEALDAEAWDYIIVHDPQPAAVLQYSGKSGSAVWIWRYHGDSSRPNHDVAHRFRHYLQDYDGAIFTLSRYRLAGYRPRHFFAIPPAIDPLKPKNLVMSLTEARTIVAHHGVNLQKPLVTQVSRFDPWKDPLGVIKVWRLARRQIPELQLALIGDRAADDPQSDEILELVHHEIASEPQAFVMTERDEDTVKAFLTVSQVVMQKSLREGFGLTVTEALWAGTPVVGTHAGGIPLQVQNGVDGYLVDNLHEAARAVVKLIRHPAQAGRMGRAGREIVREKFLLPRLVRDNFTAWLATTHQP